MHNALAFLLHDEPVAKIEPLEQGNINDTWCVNLVDGRRLILQCLHPSVFPDPAVLMVNLRVIVQHLNQYTNDNIRFFHLLANPQGHDHWIDNQGACWRLLSFIDNSRTLANLHNTAQAETVGSLLGRFHLLVADLSPDTLADPLPDFHITPRYLALYDALQNARSQAATTHSKEQELFCAALIEAARPEASILEEARGGLRQQVIHGDPKAANFLFAADRDQAISLIDFDTIKPGLVLHDLGDCLRSCCNPLGEGYFEPTAVVFQADFFYALMRGYLREASHLLSETDRALVVHAAALLSFELGLRFFTDHLAGNCYFKTEWPGQNLHRALVQFHLYRSIRAQQADLEQGLAELVSLCPACNYQAGSL
jgi:hypothetical protein